LSSYTTFKSSMVRELPLLFPSLVLPTRPRGMMESQRDE
jgi:hypothetical protein